MNAASSSSFLERAEMRYVAMEGNFMVLAAAFNWGIESLVMVRVRLPSEGDKDVIAVESLGFFLVVLLCMLGKFSEM